MTRNISLAAILALASFCIPPRAAAESPDSAAQKPIVILITIDGFPARALNDPRLPMPTLREMARNGAVAKGMIPINPTVTWPNHTTLITGVNASEHQVIANGLMVFPENKDTAEVEPSADKDVLVHVPTLYDIAAEHGLTTAQVDWVAVSGAHNIRWQFEEKPDVRGAIAQDLIAEKLVTPEQVEKFGDGSSPAWRDEIWTDAAIDILERHTPDLLLVHLLQTDTLQHRYGPMTPAAYAAYAYADHCLSRIVAAVQHANLQDRVTYLVVSDHGFSSYTHVIKPAVVLREKGFVHGDGTPTSVWVKAEGGHADVFLAKKDNHAPSAASLAEAFRAVPGIEHVYTNQQAQAFGLPALSSSTQAPDLWLTAAPGYAFDDGEGGADVQDVPARGQHGYPNSSAEMQALFVASGARIRPGAVLPVFENLQIAPTIAHILGLPLPQAKAKPLLEILR